MFKTNRFPDGVVCETSDMLGSLGVKHLFSTRYGGVSLLPHLSSMNLGENRGDDPENVEKNFDILLSHIGHSFADTVRGGQVHSTNIRYVTEEDRGRFFESTDGFVTDRAGVVLVCKVADCTPILLADKAHHVIAAVHAGWRGSAAGIAAGAVELMCRHGASPEDIHAAIGSCLHDCCFEVKDDFRREIVALCGENMAKRVIKRREGKMYADNVLLNVDFLVGCGVSREHIDISPWCTKCTPERFFSHRASGNLRGTMAGMIVL